ncbi:MAG: hypothetical protein QOE87_198 [Gaiellales bacterium]|jgi:hypothetical protein|nr:hypothetical protein [Gaiellales bacterium]
MDYPEAGWPGRPASPSKHALTDYGIEVAGLPRRRIYDLRRTPISHWLALVLGSF